MANIADDKRLDDDELEGVAGGVTPALLDPLGLAGSSHTMGGAAHSGDGSVLEVNKPTPPAAAPHEPATPVNVLHAPLAESMGLLRQG